MPSEQAFPQRPTRDVDNTIAWLIANHFALVEHKGPEGMGFQMFLYGRSDGARVRLSTQRDQWMSDLWWPTWGNWFDLDVIVHAMSGTKQWDIRPTGPLLPDQLPVGVEWKHAIPEALLWAASMPDAVSVLERLQRERADAMFGPTPDSP